MQWSESVRCVLVVYTQCALRTHQCLIFPHCVRSSQGDRSPIQLVSWKKKRCPIKAIATRPNIEESVLLHQWHADPIPYTSSLFSGSIYSTLAVAIERYVSVCHPHFVGYSEAGKLSVAGLILFSIVFNICRFLEFETTYKNVVSSSKSFLHSVWKRLKNFHFNEQSELR